MKKQIFTSSFVMAVDCHPTKDFIIIGSMENTCAIVDMATALPEGKKTRDLQGHDGYVGSVKFIEGGSKVVSAGGDADVKYWDAERGQEILTLHGHETDAGSISFPAGVKGGSTFCTGSTDKTVKLWDLSQDLGHGSGNAGATRNCSMTIAAHDGDVYTVEHHPGGEHFVTGSYDKTVKLFDLRTQQLTKTFTGHDASVSSAIFNPHGNLVISCSKDKTIKFWDILSGVCIKTLSEQMGEVTSVQINSNGILLLSSSKNSCNRLWDIRVGRPLPKRFKGHQNTSKNFVTAGFGPSERLIVGGSEDGAVYLWDAETTNFLQRLEGHTDIVYQTAWNNAQSLLASCSHDGTVKTWGAVRQ